jgi:hypothetical protein
MGERWGVRVGSNRLQKGPSLHASDSSSIDSAKKDRVSRWQTKTRTRRKQMQGERAQGRGDPLRGGCAGAKDLCCVGERDGQLG